MLIKGIVQKLKLALAPIFTKQKFGLSDKAYEKLMTGKPFNYAGDAYAVKRLIFAGKAKIVIQKNVEAQVG